MFSNRTITSVKIGSYGNDRENPNIFIKHLIDACNNLFGLQTRWQSNVCNLPMCMGTAICSPRASYSHTSTKNLSHSMLYGILNCWFITVTLPTEEFFTSIRYGYFIVIYNGFWHGHRKSELP
jgi:hypothetical protein